MTSSNVVERLPKPSQHLLQSHVSRLQDLELRLEITHDS